MARVVAEEIWDYLEANTWLPSQQFSFRCSRSTIKQLSLIFCDVAKWVDEGEVVDIAYLDFSKAFHLVCYEILLEKSVALGLYSYLKSLIRGFLQVHPISVFVAEKLSPEVEISSWIPQGSVL